MIRLLRNGPDPPPEIFQRKTVAFPRHMEGVLRHVASGRPVEAGSIPVLGPLERMRFAPRLVRERFLTIVA
jgi:hypothetical protein